MAGFSEYHQYDGIGLAQLIANGQVSAAEILQAALAQIAALNPTINAVCWLMDEEARTQIQHLQDGSGGVLCGCPILIKDLLADIKGVPTRCGSYLLADHIPQRDNELIRRYRAAGLIFAGKTTTPELGLSPYTESALYGITRNPWNTQYTPGGSSGGSAAAVAAGMVPIAHGSDGGGSIRIPASNCGVFGLKPTRGRSPCGPNRSEGWQGWVSEHVLTRSVRDSAAMLDVMVYNQALDPLDAYHWPAPETSFFAAHQQEPNRLRIAWTDQPLLGGQLHPDCATALYQSLALLESLGHEVERAHPPLATPDSFQQAIIVMVCGETAGFIRQVQSMTGQPVDPKQLELDTWRWAYSGERISAGELAWARRFALSQMRAMVAFHQRYDILVTPTLNQPPARVGTLNVLPKRMATVSRLFSKFGWNCKLPLWVHWTVEDIRRLSEYVGWTTPFNMTGQPAISVPLFWNKAGLPIGVQCVGRMGDELTLLCLAKQLEQAKPWAGYWPQLVITE